MAYTFPRLSTFVLLSDNRGATVKIEPTTTMLRLAQCESSNNPKAINPHDGGSPSYGLYQYKRGTWVYFVRKYGLFPEAEDLELQNLIMDREAQNLVTSKVLENKENWKHWYNCLLKVDNRT